MTCGPCKSALAQGSGAGGSASRSDCTARMRSNRHAVPRSRVSPRTACCMADAVMPHFCAALYADQPAEWVSGDAVELLQELVDWADAYPVSVQVVSEALRVFGMSMVACALVVWVRQPPHARTARAKRSSALTALRARILPTASRAASASSCARRSHRRRCARPWPCH